MSKLQDIIDAGGVCAWRGAQKREVVPLSAYTVQGSGRGTAGDAVSGAVRGMTAGKAALLAGSGAAPLRFGKGAR